MTPVSTDPGRWPRLHEAQRRVLFEVLVHGAQSRVGLAHKLDLSRTSLTRLSRELVELGFVEEGEVVSRGTRGRPQEMLLARPDAAHLFGAKLTGDTLYSVVTDLAGKVMAQDEQPLQSREVGDVVDLISTVASRLLEGFARPAAVGVCLAGDVRKVAGREFVDRSIFLGWDAVPLAELVAQRTGLPTASSNDVQALTVGRHWFGTGGRSGSLVLFGIGAGIGSGIISGNELLLGAHGRPGKIGHSRVGGAGRRCEKGHVDCVHSFVTMRAIESNTGVGEGEYALALESARAGGERALAAFARAAYALGAVVAQSVNVIDPTEIVITGEGTDMLDLAPGEFDTALVDWLEDVDPAAVAIERQPFEFGLYARGAAISALQHILQ